MSNGDSAAEIAEVARAYVTAMTRGDRAELERIFFEKSCEVGHYKGELLWNSREALIAMCEKARDTETEPFWAIRTLAVHDDIAVVHVEDDWAGMRFDDLLTLVKHDGAWRVVSKVYRIRG